MKGILLDRRGIPWAATREILEEIFSGLPLPEVNYFDLDGQVESLCEQTVTVQKHSNRYQQRRIYD